MSGSTFFESFAKLTDADTSTQPQIGANRRDLLKLGALAAAATAGAAGCSSSHLTALPLSPVADADEPGRVEMDLDAGWKFLKQGFPGAEHPQFNDASWSTVNLPHTWNGQDGQTGAPYYRGPAWYRRQIDLPPAHADDPHKQFFLYAQGACIFARVYCNGRLAGEHTGAFGGFCIDLTPHINRSGRNVLAVRVDNSPNNVVAPLTGDFNMDGGLYRHVRLLAMDSLSISPLDDGGPGVYIKQVRVTPDIAELEITTLVRNASDTKKTAGVGYTILDAHGNSLATGAAAPHVPAGKTVTCVQRVELKNPHLWHGRQDPYIHQVRVDIFDGGHRTDRVLQPLGLRFFHIDPDKGFFLNGESYPLHGVCLHQDRPHKGRAVSDADLHQDIRLIHELGATCVRMAHYQHPQASYDEADKLGIVVWAEDGLVNGVAHTDIFAENQKRQLRELIKQNFNHPSICFWSLYNELGNSGPHKLGVHLVAELNAEARRLDPTRPTTAADDQSPSNPLGYITDIVAFNRYPGWYGGKPSEYPSILDGIRKVVEARSPGRCIGMSEYGAGASIYQHENHVVQPNPGAYWHPEEWQCIVHEHAWAAMKQRPWLWGTFLWVMFDFASAGRHEGDHPGINDKGLMTHDRKTRKDAFFYYKAQWTSEPLVHITSKRFNCRPDAHSVFKVYANCQVVELKLNGKSLGARSGVNGVFVWPRAELTRGANTVVAIGRKADKTVQDACTIVYDPDAPKHANYR